MLLRPFAAASASGSSSCCCRHLRRYSSIPAAPSASASASASASTSASSALSHYAQQQAQAVTFADLKRYGVPPLKEDRLLESAERTRKSLLAGLARRVTDHLSLPFLPATNPSLQSIYALYASAFAALSAIPEIKTLEDNELLCKAMAKMVDEHRDNIPILAKGFQESRRYLADDRITAFLDRAIRNRITLRLTAEQHLSLSDASTPSLRSISPSNTNASPTLSIASTSSNPPAKRIGVLDLQLNPTTMVKSCASFVTSLCDATYGVSPSLEIEDTSSNVPVGIISVHLEYILTELLKNAFRATVEHHSHALLKGNKEDGSDSEIIDDGSFRFTDLPMAHLERSDFPKVVVTIGVVPGVLTIRIRDRGGGIAPENLASVFSYAFTTVAPPSSSSDDDPDSPLSPSVSSLDEDSSGYYGIGGAGSGVGGRGGGGDGHGNGESTLKTELGTLAGLGFGLPLSRLYAAYFGGSLDLVSMHGWGTDVFVVLRTV